MARPLELIDQDIAELEQAAQDLAGQFQKTYRHYLTTLGQAVRQQLVLAGYHICTQGYPEHFLDLSLSQKQQLQSQLRLIVKKAEAEAIALVEDPNPEDSPVVLIVEGLSEQGTPPEDITLVEEEQELTPLEEIADPENLSNWQDRIESGIVQLLQQVSHETNQVLRAAGIGSKNVPAMLLEAAEKLPNSEAIGGPPNLVTLTLEAQGTDELPQMPGLASLLKGPVHIMAVHLRLTDLEFADSRLSASRGQIRSLSGRLNSLKRDYHQKQRERAIAQAEAAWRSSWFED
ncbi:hypothetical protein [Laspinema olomoucense]|uniref:Uncharacterized protein n=1 Tax=Laspinema olomoucense D3b TaxID=2953688 RepID=A0ABT2NDE3_9CYAN|nr:MULTISPECIES: hypothetical protein [unclassified Laspinema]MCT7980707.1 hypothetical protein [Laspinema sp. D3b]MCT7988624.1 hypothetical protein [Laspinema sp. D3a]MCT7993848.1 hypothetical protein [Laspinema sp. D3c]